MRRSVASGPRAAAVERKLDAIETVFTWGEQTLRALVALPAMEASPAPTGESARCAALAAPARMR